MKKVYCCDASRSMYEDYYAKQGGGQMPVFAGARYQRGHGIGNFFASIKRFAMPLLKRVGKFLLPRALNAGADIAINVLEGKKFKDTAKERLKNVAKESADRLFATGHRIVDDVISGKNLKESARHRIFDDISDDAQEADPQSGSGFRRGKSAKRLCKRKKAVYW